MAEPDAVSRFVVERGTVRIAVIAEGRGPLLVLLPSIARGSEDFGGFAARIAAAGFRVLRPQPRGIGGSAGPMDGLTLHDLAADVAAVIEAEGGGPAVVAGHAFGSWIARAVAADHPGLVRGTVLIAAAAKVIPPEVGARVVASGDPSRPVAERLAALSAGFFAPGHDPSPWLDGWHPEVGASQRAAGRDTPRGEWWGGGEAPILEIQAALDPFKPPTLRDELKGELGDRVTVALIEDASHALIPEQPVAVAEIMVRWMRGLPGL